MQINDRGNIDGPWDCYAARKLTIATGLASSKPNYQRLLPFVACSIKFFNARIMGYAESQFKAVCAGTREILLCLSHVQGCHLIALFAGATGVICSQQTAPCQAQSSIANEKGPVIYAAKDISKGSVIRVIDLTKSEIAQAKIPGKALPSALLIVGRKAHHNLLKGQLIFSQDIELSSSVNERRRKTLSNRELKIARSKWTAPSDVSWEHWAEHSKSGPTKNAQP